MVFSIMVQGLGKYQREQRSKTESKIVAFLNLQPFGFNELQSISGIRRNSLRDSLDSLVDRKIVITIKNPAAKRRGTYYSLNMDKPAAKKLLDVYYNDRLPPPPKKIKEELSNSFDILRKYCSKQAKIIGEQADIFKKEVEPKLITHKPHDSLYKFGDTVLLSRRYIDQLDKIAKIFAIKARLRLDYVDKVK